MHNHTQIYKQDFVFPLKWQFCSAGEGKGPWGMPFPHLSHHTSTTTSQKERAWNASVPERGWGRGTEPRPVNVFRAAVSNQARESPGARDDAPQVTLLQTGTALTHPLVF